MRCKIYGNTVEPACEVCLHGKISTDGKVVLCHRKGSVPLYHHCRKFTYDPLKREPKKIPPLSKHSPEEFLLD